MNNTNTTHTATGPHCELCGRNVNPQFTEDGYTGCCNERSVQRKERPMRLTTELKNHRPVLRTQDKEPTAVLVIEIGEALVEVYATGDGHYEIDVHGAGEPTEVSTSLDFVTFKVAR